MCPFHYYVYYANVSFSHHALYPCPYSLETLVLRLDQNICFLAP